MPEKYYLVNDRIYLSLAKVLQTSRHRYFMTINPDVTSNQSYVSQRTEATSIVIVSRYINTIKQNDFIHLPSTYQKIP